MSTKNRPSKSKSSTSLAVITGKFWGHIEERCMLDGVPILERPYYGLRPGDYIQFVVTTPEGEEQIIKRSIEDQWRRYCSKLGINADLVLASSQAVAAGLLKSSNRKGKDAKNPDKTRSFGVQFWTPFNKVYMAKMSTKATPTVNADALIDALIGQ